MKRSLQLCFMKTRLFILILHLAVFTPAWAQEEAEPQGNQYRGIVLDNEGAEHEVIIETNLNYPWITQKYIRYFDDSLLRSGERVKLRDKPKYDAKSIAGFRLEGKEYEAHKYESMTTLDIKIRDTYYFFEVAIDGPIKLYKLYESPPLVMEGDSERIYEELRKNPDIIMSKGDSKLTVASSGTLEKFISDCPAVAEKYNHGDYNNKLVEQTDGKKKSKLKSLINRVTNTPSVNSYVFEVVTEYNTIMSNPK